MQYNELRMSEVVKIRYMCVLMGNILLKIKRDYFNLSYGIYMYDVASGS